MKLVERVREWNTERKLRRGRCAYCEAILPDDETSPYCSDECAWALLV